MRGFIGFEDLDEVINDRSLSGMFYIAIAPSKNKSPEDCYITKNFSYRGIKFMMQHFSSNKSNT